MDELNNKLIEASEKGDLKLVTQLLENGADLNTTNKDGETPLNVASSEGHKEIKKILNVLTRDDNTFIKTISNFFAALTNFSQRHNSQVKINPSPDLQYENIELRENFKHSNFDDQDKGGAIVK